MQRGSHLEQTLREKDLYSLFQDGQQASMMDSYSPLQQRQHMLHLRNTKSVVNRLLFVVFVYEGLVTV